LIDLIIDLQRFYNLIFLLHTVDHEKHNMPNRSVQ